MLCYHLLCIVSAYLLILYISVSLSVLLPNVANKRVHYYLRSHLSERLFLHYLGKTKQAKYYIFITCIT